MTASAHAAPALFGPWSTEEDAVVRANYKRGSVVVAQMTGRTMGAVQKRAAAINVVHRIARAA